MMLLNVTSFIDLFHLLCKVSVSNVVKEIDSFSTKMPTFIIKIELITMLFGMINPSFTDIRIDFRDIEYIRHTDLYEVLTLIKYDIMQKTPQYTRKMLFL